MIPFARMIQYGNVKPVYTDILKVQSSSNMTALLMSNGYVYVRGTNSAGSLGNGTSNTAVTGDWYLTITNANKMWIGFQNILVYTNDGKWMSTGNIQYLSGTSSGSNVWRDVSSYFTAINPVSVKQVQIGTDTMFMLLDTGQIYSSGANTYGVQGRGNTTAVNGLTLTTSTYGSNTWSEIAYNQGTFYALRTDGQVWGSGRADVGQCGATSSTGVLSPRFLSANHTHVQAGSMSGFASRTDGLYAIGSQFWGQLGDGTVSSNVGTVGKTVFTNVRSGLVDHIWSNSYMTTILSGSKLYSTGNINRGSLNSSTNIGVFTEQLNVPIFDESKIADLYTIGASTAYIVDVNGDLWGTGIYSASNDLLPGHTTNQMTYVKLDMSGIDRG